MKRLKPLPAEVAAARGTQITALNVLPAKRSPSFCGPLEPLALVPEPNAAASATAQIPRLAGSPRVFIRIRWSPWSPSRIVTAMTGRVQQRPSLSLA
jgi:hypothetical protein